MTQIGKNISISHSKLRDASAVETIICLATLIATKQLAVSSSVKDAEDYFENQILECCRCSAFENCLAVKMWE